MKIVVNAAYDKQREWIGCSKFNSMRIMLSETMARKGGGTCFKAVYLF